ncbi:glucuronyl esterase domain-containing protein [Reichenbachiella ulvae]|uniref:Acetylxylan esterase n=1 Tax=Reichenbachiella ulvae TaxID=2980104 RepID=A0ABT3CP36_9BACT|nr:acetylxylan esterase [Reichenbachiella ulvae]MCV9385394.1 acetylxylan esterase [Reichenbachiella ulvae]
MNKYILLIGLLGTGIFAHTQRLSQAQRDSIYQLTVADFEQMKEQLGISIPNRPGPSGDPSAPNAANSDESKVRSYDLPDPLRFDNGKPVQSSKEWWSKRRPEIVEHFDREIYGRVPKNVPSVTWQVLSEKDTTIGSWPIVEKRLKGVVDNSSYPDLSVEIELLIATPASATEKVPLVLEFGFINWPFGPRPDQSASILSSNEPGWKEQLISRGWGYAIIVPHSIQADNGAGLRAGIIGLTNQGKTRTPEQWGALRAWAWGASRAMDYFEVDDDIDAKRVAIEGLSRYGKAAAVTLAYDDRFSIGFIGSSGAGGLKILRRNFGESVENLASSGEYHWFCGNFIKYASTHTADDLPVDAHQLVALCAPRPVFISLGSPVVEGNWIDAKGNFLAGVHAGPVYELLGKKGLSNNSFPPLGTAMTEGDIAYRQHAGGHTTGPNWSTWIAWACRYWGDCGF